MRTLVLTVASILLVVAGLAFANAQSRRQIICNPNSVTALHETENIYPAWKYECAEGYDIIILD